jgi:hypothetical protein
MLKLLNFFCNPLVIFTTFLAGIGVNVALQVPAEGLGRLLALVPTVALLVTSIATSDMRKRMGC